MTKEEVQIDLKILLARSLSLDRHFEKRGNARDQRAIQSIKGIAQKLVLKYCVKPERRRHEKRSRA